MTGTRSISSASAVSTSSVSSPSPTAKSAANGFRLRAWERKIGLLMIGSVLSMLL
jgi:hypothetical protein